MAAVVTAPTIQLLAWLAEQSRSYSETIEVWKTSCPRLAVWEDSLADKLVRIEAGRVHLTAAGGKLLAMHRESHVRAGRQRRTST